MREILFRAKRIDNGEWVEGFLFSTNDHTYIAYQNQFDDDLFLSPKKIFIEVDSETVCQYVDFDDKTRKKIFEKDICEMVCDDEVHIYVVVWDKSEHDFKGTNGKENYGIEFEYLPCCDEIVIVGNIFDTPELIK